MKFCRRKDVDEVVKGIVFMFICFVAWYARGQSSVLSTGNWYKIGVTETGLYKLDAPTLNNLGINTSSLDPRTIKVYGSDVRGMLPQSNAIVHSDDPVEHAVFVSGEEDGTFDDLDFVLFYGVDPDEIRWTSDGLIYENNVYSDTTYYFVTSGGVEGKRIGEKPSLEGSGMEISTYDDMIVFEEDVNNILGSGREWFGELFGSGENQSFRHTLEGITSDIRLVVNAIGQSGTPSFFAVEANGQLLGNIDLHSIRTGFGTTYSLKASQSVDVFLIKKIQNLDIRLTYEAHNPLGRGFLDYYLLFFERELSLNGSFIQFRNDSQMGNLLRFQVKNGSSATIWDVSDPSNIQHQAYRLSGSHAVFQSQSEWVEEYIAFTGNDFPYPFLSGRVANQDLKANAQLDGIIVSHPNFIEEAARLAQFHQINDDLTVTVVTPQQIYNEFSSGRQDVSAIRDYAKYVHENGGRLNYLLLFGDCSFDYKFRENANTNFVPTYESRESFHPIFSYSSDDYYGFFETGEGEWVESSSGDHTLEIGVGRLPAKTSAEAQTMVDKIVYYSTSPNTLGNWRNTIAYMADDGDGNIHASHVEDLSRLIDTTYRQYSIDKLLLDTFDQVGASSERSPGATQALKSRIKRGAFAINYIGHGNERSWAEEQVLTQSLVRALNNRNRMPIFVTATCEFGRYDDPRQVSGAEELLLNENGGAIALLTTSRPVFASTNFELNEAFHENAFRKEKGQFRRLGDIIRTTKNNGLAGRVNRNFTLLGDPMMTLAYPALDITINELTTETDTLSALEKITFTGQVESNSSIHSNFNGRLSVALFDIEQNFLTKGQEQGSVPFNYSLRNNAIFRGESSVASGRFSFTFVVPKNISYQFQKGKVSLYAWDEQNNIDAAGSSNNFVLGGTSSSAIMDNEAPEVDLFLNDETFVNGSSVGSSSLLIANVSDENGISITSSGLSQGVSLELDGEIFNLNEFYSSNVDSYQAGTIVYPIQDLEPGEYRAVLNVYDTHNNLTKEAITFRVSDVAFISIFNPVVYPNPVANATAFFSFEHDREDEDLSMQLFVYDSQGDLVNKTNFDYQNSSKSVQLTWRAATHSGQPLSQGIYFYRLVIKSEFDGAVKEITNRLVIIN